MAKFKVTQVTSTRFVGVTTLADIRGNCLDPKRVDTSTEAQRNADPDLQRAFSQRSKNQRKFDKKRCERTDNYGRYIKEVDNGERLGGYPPITLWTSEPATGFDPDAGELTVAGSVIITASDGETQLAARYGLAKADPSWLDKPFAFTLEMECNMERAMQTLHDMNHHATPVSENDTATLNVEGPLTGAINKGVEMRGWVENRDVFIKQRGANPTGTYLTTEMVLLYGSLGVLHGDQALKRTPTALLKESNHQFHKIAEADVFKVASFVDQMLRFGERLKTIDTAQSIAMGVKFGQTGQLPQPLEPNALKSIEEQIKAENHGKRRTVHKQAASLILHLGQRDIAAE